MDCIEDQKIREDKQVQKLQFKPTLLLTKVRWGKQADIKVR
jgi:hypothetical protein